MIPQPKTSSRYLLLLSILFHACVTNGLGQKVNNTIRFENLLNLFPKVNLPDTIQYSADEFDYAYYEPEEQESDNDTTFDDGKGFAENRAYKNYVLKKPDSLRIPDDDVILFLLTDSEKRYHELIIDSLALPVYYPGMKIQTNHSFYCLIFEMQFYSQELSYCHKYLCTITKSGKLIDKIKVASADYAGTGIMGDGFRVPWFPDEKSILDKNLFLYYFKQGLAMEIDGSTGATKLHPDVLYQIEHDGKIKKIKSKG